MIPDYITREHIIQAINRIDVEGFPKFNRSTKFDLLHERKRYPPKYVISLAHIFIDGKKWSAGNFSGGEETNNFLNGRNFKVIPKNKHFLQYWLPEQVEYDSSFGENLIHAGSNQYGKRKVKVGDVVWIVTVKNNGELYLIGRIFVDEIISHADALMRFSDEVFDREFHIVTRKENSKPFKSISLMDVVEDLRFNSKNSKKLYLINGRIDAKQLQTIRELTSESVALIESKWRGENFYLQQEIDHLNSEEEEENNIKQRSIPTTQKEALILARRGQGKFRTNLESIENACRLTGIKYRKILIASHIKAWKDSSDEEKLDGNNGLLLSPHVDKLFDRGWISFSDDGKVLCKNDEIEEIMKIWGLDPNKNVGSFNENQKLYLSYHRKAFNFE